VVIPGRLGRRTFILAAASGAAALVVPSIVRLPRLAWADAPELQTRVLIRRGDSSLDAPSITVSGDGEIAATDGNDELILKASAQRPVTVGRDGDAFWVQLGDDKRSGLTGPIRFNGTGDGAPLRNQSTSSGDPTPYRGTLEVTSSPGGRVALVNVLGLEEYIYGVVTKELPASFGAEPLKAQAVAARTYAIARKQVGPHTAQNADLCDTQHCQAFSGLTGEHAAGRDAVDATRGRVLLHAGNVFEPFYASACGGYTESASRIFGNGGGDDADAVADGEVPNVNLASDDGALSFYKASWDSNCSGSNRYRWSYSWSPDEIRAMVNAGIARFQGTQTVAASGDSRVDLLENVTVPERGPSGRALSVRFEAPGVSWTVKRDWGIRNFMRIPSGDLLPSSAIGLEIERGDANKITKLTAYGAGWGHGSGMCQWGTRGLAARGLAFDAILGYYYPTADLGDVAGSGPVSSPVRTAPPPPVAVTATPTPAATATPGPTATPASSPPPASPGNQQKPAQNGNQPPSNGNQIAPISLPPLFR
jgi:peptidoglycan hydrolase-like amidase